MFRKVIVGGLMAFFCAALVAYAQEDQAENQRTDYDSQQDRQDRENRESRERQSRENSNRDDDSEESSYSERDEARRENRRERMEDRDEAREDREDRRSDRRSGISFRNNRRGLIVGNVDPLGTAARVGLRVGDQVLSVSERPVETAAQFSRLIAIAAQQVPITVWRNGRERTIMWSNDEGNIYVRNSGNRDSFRDRDNSNWRDSERDESTEDEGPREAFLGVVFDTRYDDAAVVRQVYRNSPAQQAGLRPGSIILSVNGDKVDCPEDVTEAVADLEPGESVEMMVSPATPRKVEVQLASRQQRHSSGYRGTRELSEQRNQREEQDSRWQNDSSAESNDDTPTPKLDSEDQDSSEDSADD